MLSPRSPGLPMTYQALRDVLYTRLLAHILLPINTDKRFFPEDTSEAVLRPDVLEEIFECLEATAHIEGLNRVAFIRRIRDRRLHKFLAVVIYSSSDVATVQAFVKNLVVPRDWPTELEDLARLPTSLENAKTVLGSLVAADGFWSNQKYFCAIVLVENEEVVCDEPRRLPYLEEEKLGQGAFGEVVRVKIAPFHFYNAQRGMKNDKAIEVARKDYILAPDFADSAHERERDIMREIVRNVKQNTNILENHGSLRIGNRYSLFMPVAYCDLWDYMMVKHTNGPTTWEEKAAIVHCAVELAGAIAYLHDDLYSDEFEKLSCFHMDLKPENILLVQEKVKDKNGKEKVILRWKLSDFNMAKVKAKKSPSQLRELQRSWTFSGGTYDFNTLFQKRGVQEQSSSAATITPRGHGTYSSPEVCAAERQGTSQGVNAESDTWSFGCVLSVVFSYMDSGASGVLEFGKMRENGSTDQFFTKSSNGTQRLSEAVQKWFKELRWRAHKRHEKEGEIYKKFLNFLQTKVLVVNASRREDTRARDIRKELVQVWSDFGELQREGLNSGNNRSPVNLSARIKDTLHLRTRSSRSSRRAPANISSFRSQQSSSRWEINLPSSMQPMLSCEFSPNGETLVYISKSTVLAKSLNNVCDTGDIKDMIEFGDYTLPSDQDSWTSMSVSNQFIAATTDQPLFDCSIFYISSSTHTSELKKRARISLHLPPIEKLALSPEGKYCACILKHPSSERGEGTVYIVPLEELLSGGSNRESDLSRKSSTTSISTASSSSTTLHWISERRRFRLPGPAEDVTEFRFSKRFSKQTPEGISETNVLYAVFQPEQAANRTEHKVTILAWAVTDQGGEAIRPPMQIVDKGDHDYTESLYTSFVPHNTKLAATVISHEKRVITQNLITRVFAQERALGTHLHKMVMNSDDSKIFCLARREGIYELKLFSFDSIVRAVTGSKLKMTELAKLSGLSYQNEYCVSLYLPNGREDAQVLIASLDGRLYQIPVDDVGGLVRRQESIS